MAQSIEDLSRKIELSIAEIPELVGRVQLFAAQQAQVELLQRTFATGGTGVRDVNGNPLSKYSDAYAKKREKAGLQTANKDLIFSSDTSAIKDNITIGFSNGAPALGHVNEKGYLISTYQEEREGVKIFELNQDERDKVALAVKDFVMAELRALVQKWNA